MLENGVLVKEEVGPIWQIVSGGRRQFTGESGVDGFDVVCWMGFRLSVSLLGGWRMD